MLIIVSKCLSSYGFDEFRYFKHLKQEFRFKGWKLKPLPKKLNLINKPKFLQG